MHAARRQQVFYNTKLSGTLPAAWSGMKAMESFDIGYCSFEGSVPSSWAPAWTQLNDVYLCDNLRLSGCLPRAWAGKLFTRDGGRDDVKALSGTTNITGLC